MSKPHRKQYCLLSSTYRVSSAFFFFFADSQLHLVVSVLFLACNPHAMPLSDVIPTSRPLVSSKCTWFFLLFFSSRPGLSLPPRLSQGHLLPPLPRLLGPHLLWKVEPVHVAECLGPWNGHVGVYLTAGLKERVEKVAHHAAIRRRHLTIRAPQRLAHTLKASFRCLRCRRVALQLAHTATVHAVW